MGVLQSSLTYDPSDCYATVFVDIAGPCLFRLRLGSCKLPSEHLTELRDKGKTVVENLLSPADCFKVKNFARKRHGPETDRRYCSTGAIVLPEVCKAVVNPIVLWIMRQYLGDRHIRCAHAPTFSEVMPATGRHLQRDGPERWHIDYPWDQTNSAVQFNVCVDPFTERNGATQYVPGSHQEGRGPPDEFNKGVTRPGHGMHKHVKPMLAPAGAAIIYDSRTWHRACPEANISGSSRVGILNAVAKRSVKPMADRREDVQAYIKSGAGQELTEQQRLDMHHLLDAPK